MRVFLSALVLLGCASLAHAGLLNLGLGGVGGGSGGKLALPSTFMVPQDVPELTPNEAAHRAQQMNGGGKILAVEAVQGGYRVKLLKNGEVKIVFVPN